MFLKTFSPQLKQEMGLYHLAKREQWDVEQDINWDQPFITQDGVPEDEARVFRQNFATQLFLGEQGAFGLCSQLGTMIPDMEARLYVSTQVVDEARHVEAFAKYAEFAGGFVQLNPRLAELLTSFVEAETYEQKMVGMQVFVEGMILEVFKAMHQNTPCPILKQMLALVIRDESRHANFGVMYLSKKMQDASPALKRKVEDSIGQWAKDFVHVMQWQNPDVPRRNAKIEQENVDGRMEVVQRGIAGLQERLGLIGLELRT